MPHLQKRSNGSVNEDLATGLQGVGEESIGIRPLESGPWNQALGIRPLESGPWNQALGIRNEVNGEAIEKQTRHLVNSSTGSDSGIGL
jgi:hypothetical protein